MKKKAILWFRNDLRINDNPALESAILNNEILPIYIFEQEIHQHKTLGSASKLWLHHSLESLNQDLDNKLNFYNDDPLEVLKKLVSEYNCESIYWNRRYEPLNIQKDTQIKKYFQQHQISVSSFNGSLLWEPHEILKNDNTPYKVFTHYYKNGCLLHPHTPRKPTILKDKPNFIKDNKFSKNLTDLKLLPNKNWGNKIKNYWHIGEKFALKKMHNFVKNSLQDYKIGRDFPNHKKVSQLSPHLHFGEISPNQIWYYAKENYNQQISDKNIESFLSELGWREFSAYLLFHFPNLPNKNFQPRFDNFSWQSNSKFLHAWQKGKTGYPIIDAGMRELWETGYMHNRVRMIVGSFLVKNLLINWQEGEKWFWDCLVDADLASNSASWQWVAGSGADAAPYFRIFNPILQGEKFDPDGAYTKKYVPELKNLPNQYLFKPWEAPIEVLNEAHIKLGQNYPQPIVTIESSRKLALEIFKMLPKTKEDILA